MKNNPNLLMTYYGDDFTGSTDSMEALTINGVKTVLFLDVPDKNLIEERFPHVQAFGIAGVGRTMSPAQMETELKVILEQLQQFHAPIIHYKICSTFDSSPEVGSIGKVIDICLEVDTTQSSIPLLVGCPFLKRYTVFGNHFATVGDQTYRLDRHPTMSKHPTTPMQEADLKIHLSKQTSKKIDLFNLLDLEIAEEILTRHYKQKSMENDAIIFDVVNEQQMERIGRLLWECSKEGNHFVIGSSGIQYALTNHWKRQQIISNAESLLSTRNLTPQQTLVVSGSCSPVTKDQIEWSLENGFKGIKISTEELLQPNKETEIYNQSLEEAIHLIRQGENVVIYTSLGPEDTSIAATKNILLALGENPAHTGRLIGEKLGRLTKEIVSKSNLKRLVIAGGDTSGYATKELGIYGLEMIMPIAPGGPLCRSYSEDSKFDGLEISLKGGQVGTSNYFGIVRDGVRVSVDSFK
ncbi:four-carbon acid sugar kinase family protein [Robertmurraya massiliosenegalensis]|uniref:four-carbon acid sugar kinase family protein n=1 Tax=Robertmurraya TaxID=2837507 RepID=UPI0039A76583